ncbi:hypothetical protein TWF281_006135 [Arthrobotrys megalospora]
MGIKGKRKQQRRQQQQQLLELQQQQTAELDLTASAESSSSTSTSIPPSLSTSSSSSTSPEPEMATIRSLLLCAIGNPGPLLTTRHSAAHILLPHLTTTTSLTPSRPHGGPTAPGPSGTTYTTLLFQSPSYMNLSGPTISKAWKLFKSSPSNPNPTLIILHDELEKPIGKVKYKKDGSPGGHNGLSSIRDSLAGGAKTTIHKIGLGIGRPESREKNVVADYVLQRMPGRDKDVMIEEALPVVLQIIEDIGTGKLK